MIEDDTRTASPEDAPTPAALEGTVSLADADGEPIRPPEPPPGYELLEEVGRGGMGVIYRARDLALNRTVAVKFLRSKYPATGAEAQRFVQEARITSQLQHPGIPPVHL